MQLPVTVMTDSKTEFTVDPDKISEKELVLFEKNEILSFTREYIG
jgi:hypothetical protein